MKLRGRPSLLRIDMAKIDAALPNGVNPPPNAPPKSSINHKYCGLDPVAGKLSTIGAKAALLPI
ncbi:hypothetical protein CEE45_12490 [Candidatus Heimdallarchaeota archaeon B3_Heim]|nr:MAG: hypothetical protein CEE45_12490 [Candidatus Heimdallarchaeota archaeon B3_Heim]